MRKIASLKNSIRIGSNNVKAVPLFSIKPHADTAAVSFEYGQNYRASIARTRLVHYGKIDGLSQKP